MYASGEVYISVNIKRMKKSKDMRFQNELVEKLREEAGDAYKDASVYTIMLDLINTTSLEEVVICLHHVSIDLGEIDKFNLQVMRQIFKL